MKTKSAGRAKVLLAWDIEDPSPKALAVVLKLIESGARAEAVYVATPSFMSMAKWDRKTLNEAWRAKLAKHGIALRFLEGAVVTRLLLWIARRRPDLVVLGSRRAGWFESALFGSVSKAVRRGSVAPVLIVPGRKRR